VDVGDVDRAQARGLGAGDVAGEVVEEQHPVGGQVQPVEEDLEQPGRGLAGADLGRVDHDVEELRQVEQLLQRRAELAEAVGHERRPVTLGPQ